MPAVSKKQFRFLQALAHGSNKIKAPGLTEEKAKEFISKNKGKYSYKNLPEFKKGRK